MKCKNFLQTAGCDPSGKIEKTSDCGDTVEAGTSGYCECAKKVCEVDESGSVTGKCAKEKLQIRKENCNHGDFSCVDACENYEKFQCDAWVATHECLDMKDLLD